METIHPRKLSIAALRPGRALKVERRLHKLAKKLGPGGKLPTVLELCRSHHVAIATMTRVLESLESRGVIDRRRGSGLYVSARVHQQRVGLVFGCNVFGPQVSPVYPMLLDYAQKRARLGNERFSFFVDMPQDADGQPHPDLADDVRAGRLHGLLFTTRGTAAQQEWRRSVSIPYVSFLPTIREPWVVGVDYARLVELGVDALARRGCRNIAYISVPTDRAAENVRDDLSAFERSTAQLGLRGTIWQNAQEVSRWLRREDVVERWDALGHQAVRQLWQGEPRPDGLVIGDDIVARGALAEAEQTGLRIGQDLHVATHANAGSYALQRYEDRIIRLEFTPAEIVEALFNLLEA
ncbi:MAG: substrate-binding domain-containing protein, partial [Tepidisphaeraceae bacterium]